MIKNYFKIALRNFWKTKLTSLINIGSLAIGIACCIIIILFVKNEWTFDQFHTKANRIYRLWTDVEMPSGDVVKMVATPYNMSRLMADDYEELDNYTTLTSFPQSVEYKGEIFPETVHMVSKGFFEMFDYKLLSGSTNNALNGLDDIVITKAVALKYFGTTDVVNQRLNMTFGEEKRSFNVKAVLDEIPSNSSLTFEFLISDENAKFVFPAPLINTWHMVAGANYVMLKPGTDPAQLEAKLPALVQKVLGDNDGDVFDIRLQPLTDIHLNNEFPAGYARVSDPKYTFILTGIALLILILGSVNFMILSVGKSAIRAKEIGVRKVVGASKQQLGMQLIAEGILLAIISLIVAVILARVALPLFNELASNNLKMELDWVNVSIFIALTIFVGFIASIYPAFVISGYQPIKVLKGNASNGGGKHYFKMILVTGQFVLSIFLVTTTVLMQKQLNYLQNKNLGFNLDQVISIPIQVAGAGGLRDQIGKGFTKAEKLKTALNSNSNIMNVSTVSQEFGQGEWIQMGWPDPETGEMQLFRMNAIDPDYIPTLKMEIVEGRNFEKDNLSDQRRSVIVNEAFVKAFGLDNPIGSKIPNPAAIDHEIIGVVKDFNFSSLHTAIAPLILVQNVNIGFSASNSVSMEADPSPKLLVRIAPNTFPETIEQIKSAWNTVYVDEPFDFRFSDAALQRQYVAEQNLGKIVSASTVLALLIGCMGLFALATLTMNARTKEISVRKVLGAPLQNILYLLSKSYFIIILIALFVSVPMTYLFADNWLSQFEYRVNIGIDSFALAGIATLLIVVLTIGFQCLKVAKANPAQTLSAE